MSPSIDANPIPIRLHIIANNTHMIVNNIVNIIIITHPFIKGAVFYAEKIKVSVKI